MRAACEAVRARLAEMVDFLQRLLADGGDGLLNASLLSNRDGGGGGTLRFPGISNFTLSYISRVPIQ